MAKTGRNDPCPCGSGEKYKRCCLAKDQAARAHEGPALGHVSSVLTNLPRSTPIPRGAAAWPIVRAYVPIEDVWRATGLGSAVIVRRRPDGLFAWAMFKLDLREHGLGLIAGKFDETPAGVDEILEQLRENMPPFEEGSPELASAYIWGAWALGEAEGLSLPPGTAEPFLALVPTPPGTAGGWLAHLLGPGGLTPAGLVQHLASLPPDEEGDETRELAVVTTMRFRIADPRAALSLVRASQPDSKGFCFVPGEPPERDGLHSFDFVRPLPEGPRSIMPVRGDLQIQGQVVIDDDEIVAGTMGLSMAAKLVASLRNVLGRGLELVETHWRSLEELAQAMTRQDDHRIRLPDLRSTAARR